jgi:hypothetical protein
MFKNIRGKNNKSGLSTVNKSGLSTVDVPDS